MSAATFESLNGNIGAEEGRDTRYGDTLGGSRGCKRIMASPRQDIPGRPDSTGESAPAPVATTVASDDQPNAQWSLVLEGDGEYEGMFDKDEDEMIESLLEVS